MGIFSGKPMADYPFALPIQDFPNDSRGRSGDAEDWLDGLLRTMGASKRV